MRDLRQARPRQPRTLAQARGLPEANLLLGAGSSSLAYLAVPHLARPGDRIVILGFSRGAYTARALAGMISGVGLLDPKSMEPTAADKDAMATKERAYRMGVSAWLRYRENAKARQQTAEKERDSATSRPSWGVVIGATGAALVLGVVSGLVLVYAARK